MVYSRKRNFKKRLRTIKRGGSARPLITAHELTNNQMFYITRSNSEDEGGGAPAPEVEEVLLEVEEVLLKVEEVDLILIILVTLDQHL